jgi:hypothetical protein
MLILPRVARVLLKVNGIHIIKVVIECYIFMNAFSHEPLFFYLLPWLRINITTLYRVAKLRRSLDIDRF